MNVTGTMEYLKKKQLKWDKIDVNDIDAIIDDLGVSKATFFAAVGRLMKEGAITTVSGTRETVFICSTALSPSRK